MIRNFNDFLRQMEDVYFQRSYHKFTLDQKRINNQITKFGLTPKGINLQKN